VSVADVTTADTRPAYSRKEALSVPGSRAAYVISSAVSHRTDRLAAAFAALAGGEVSDFRDLLLPEAQWPGVPGSGWRGETAT
jgi:hypothetical protein